MQLQPYLFFEGRCDEALQFYRDAVGAEVTTLMRYRDAPDTANVAPSSMDKVMHAAVKVGEATFMASDGHNSGQASFGGFALTLTAQDDNEAERLFNALAEGGQVRLPLGPTFFATRFGMLTDKFGVGWMIMAAAT